MTESNIEEARGYTKEALMKLSKPELIAVADEIGVDLAVLPKLTKGSISDAVIVFLEPHLDSEDPADAPADEHGPFDDPPAKVPAEMTVVAGEEEKKIPAEEGEVSEVEEETESVEEPVASHVVEETETIPVVEEVETTEEPTEIPEPCETEEVVEAEEQVEPEEPLGPAPTVVSGSHQEILRPVKVEQSVRVRRIAESNK